MSLRGCLARILVSHIQLTPRHPPQRRRSTLLYSQAQVSSVSLPFFNIHILMELKTEGFLDLTCHQHALKPEQKNKYTAASEPKPWCITRRISSREWNCMQKSKWSLIGKSSPTYKEKKMFLEKRTLKASKCNFLTFCWHVDKMITEGKTPPIWYALHV